MATGDKQKPEYVQFRKGRWYWEPSKRLRRDHGLETTALGADMGAAWAYAEKLNAHARQLAPGAGAPGTVQWIFEQFFLTEKFNSLGVTTQRDYRWILRMLSEAKFAGKPVAERGAKSLKARHADSIFTLLRDKHSPAAAHYAARVCRRVWKWAARKEFVDAYPNPWAGMELPTARARDQVWSEAQVRAVIAAAVKEAKPSIGLAVLLAYWIGHRQGDILTLKWAQLDAQMRETSKTGRKVPLVAEAYPELDRALTAERARQQKALKDDEATLEYVLICEATSQPWNRWTFGRNFREVATVAGLPSDLQFRDLRATAQTELADIGASLIEMRTHSGHTTVAMASRYARPTAKQFRSAAEKRLSGKSEAKSDGTGDGTAILTEPTDTTTD